MQAIPSLIGTGTAVAAATTGLVFGQVADGQFTHPTHRDSLKRKSCPLPEFTFRAEPSPKSADSTSAALALPHNAELLSSPSPTANPPPPRPHHRSSDPRLTPPRRPSTSRRAPPTTSPRLLADQPTFESRDSLSSNGSWLRRMPLRPLSQHGSFRSSLFDSTSITFSHGSGAPILPASRHQGAVLPPNKLVKRASAANSADPIAVVQLGSKPQLTLRRPATSHQRSATLQQQIDVEALAVSLNKTSVDCQPRPRAQTLSTAQQKSVKPESTEVPAWKSFWHARIGRQAPKSSTFRSGEAGLPVGPKRIRLDENTLSYVYLVNPQTVIMGCERTTSAVDIQQQPPTDDSPSDKSSAPLEETSSRFPHRPTSLHITSPKSWIHKTGSIRRRKRADLASADKGAAYGPSNRGAPPPPLVEEPSAENTGRERQPSRAEVDLTAIFRPPISRKSSASLKHTASRSSSLRLEHSAPVAELRPQPIATSTTTTPSPKPASQVSHARSNDRASTAASSDYYRGFTSGEEDETDMKTDTPFDSFRTVGSSKKKTGETTLDSLFDESPPSPTGLAPKPTRMSIQEILGSSYEDSDKIIEEDESISTPVRKPHSTKQPRFQVAESDGRSHIEELSKDLRASLDDDDDLGWTQEDEMHVYNNLSPPSSTNSRRASPGLLMALSAVDTNPTPEGINEMNQERRRSTVFDWVESAYNDNKQGGEHQTPRPTTAHGKKDRDIRGGRSASRKGPTVAHIRSQSVPAVDPPEKPVPKFGTWGLGSKNVSEDWDEDFEFDEVILESTAESSADANRLSMVVPPSIQATQHTLKAHSGQIRELSLLVNDLKRLCRLGRETEIMDGASKQLWLEAEDIIALASPDEDAEHEGARHVSQQREKQQDERFTAQGFDGSSLDASKQELNLDGDKSDVCHCVPAASRRRSVFSPDDDIFGTWDHLIGPDSRPRTPDNPSFICNNPSSVTKTVMEAMRTRSNPAPRNDADTDLTTRLNFDTNSLRELVKRASELRDALSDIIRKADSIAQSPAMTPKRSDRHDGSPAFTRVFDDPASSPTKRPPSAHKGSTSSYNSKSVSASPATSLNQRMHMMTVG